MMLIKWHTLFMLGRKAKYTTSLEYDKDYDLKLYLERIERKYNQMLTDFMANRDLGNSFLLILYFSYFYHQHIHT